LYTALNIDEKYSCLILAKDRVDISNTWYAQGGIAAAVSTDDAPLFHLEIRWSQAPVSAIKTPWAVLVAEGPDDIARLVSMHVPFDVNEFGDLSITREGGHRKNRIATPAATPRPRGRENPGAHRRPTEKILPSVKTPVFTTSFSTTPAQ
jgi:L-aspartate oxidase